MAAEQIIPNRVANLPCPKCGSLDCDCDRPMTGICRGCGHRVELYQPTGTHNVWRTTGHARPGAMWVDGMCSGSFGPADRYEKKKET